MLSTVPSSHTGRPNREVLARWATRPFPHVPSSSPLAVRRFEVSHGAPPRSIIRRTTPRVHAGLLPLLVAVFALLNAGDLISTFIGLAGGMREGNPLMNMLLTQYGFGALILYKLLVIVGVSAGVLLLRVLHRRVAYVTIWVCNLLVLGVVVSNLMQFTPGR